MLRTSPPIWQFSRRGASVNVGATAENYRVMQVAKLVEEVVREAPFAAEPTPTSTTTGSTGYGRSGRHEHRGR